MWFEVSSERRSRERERGPIGAQRRHQGGDSKEGSAHPPPPPPPHSPTPSARHADLQTDFAIFLLMLKTKNHHLPLKRPIYTLWGHFASFGGQKIHDKMNENFHFLIFFLNIFAKPFSFPVILLFKPPPPVLCQQC